MASSQFIPSPVPHCSHYDQPGIIVPPLSTASLNVTGSNPVLSNSPCPECALHSTILHSMAFNMQSMDYSGCQHLHASSSCSSCYSNYQLQQGGSGLNQGTHNSHVFQGQCGHMQQSYEQYAHRLNHSHVPSSTPYPGYQYNDWRQQPVPSNHGGFFMPPITNSALPNSHCDNGIYSHLSMGAIPLPSPTISIPPISPFLSCQETTKSTPVAPQVRENLKHTQSQIRTTNYSFQNGNSQTDHKIERAGFDTIPNLSGMNISDIESKPVIKNENTNKRKLQKNTEKRKNKTVESKSSEARKRQPEDICQVCGDRASGYHYNALTCEGCKGFFRRSITNKTSYKQGCKQGGNCEMDTYTRRKCPYCRLKKCKEVGMLEECLLTEIQCQSKRRRRKQKQEQAEEIKQQDETSQCTSVTSPAQSSVASSPCGSDSSQGGDGVSLILTEEEGQLIETVTEAYKHYKINPEIVRRWENYINKESKTSCRLADITTVHVQVLVEYAKNLPGFLSLDSQEQISLLKGSVFEAMLFRNSCGYHHLTKAINMPAIMDEIGVDANPFQALIDFFSLIGKLGMDETEYALLIAVVVFNSDYPHVKNKAVVEEYQDLYLGTLAKYSLTREPIRPSIFAKILATLTEIRSLTHFNAEIVTSWKKRGALTPLLCEIWDLD